MDDYLFRSHVNSCRAVPEVTRSLEITTYSNPSFDNVVEHELADYDFEDFLNRKGMFSPPPSRYGVKPLGTVRLVVQKEAVHPDTFSPGVISLEAKNYEQMVDKFNLPTRAIEGTSVVGPFFWSFLDHKDKYPRLHIVFRKSDTKKQGKTEGWEVVLSHCFETRTTTGFVKGTSTSHIKKSIQDLLECTTETNHPLLLPLILLSYDLGSDRDQQLRDTRDWVRRLEHSISQRIDTKDDLRGGAFRHAPTGNSLSSMSSYGAKDGMADIEDTNRALVECHAQVLRKRPQDWLEIIANMEEAMSLFRSRTLPDAWTDGLEATHTSILGRLAFYRTKLRAIEGYVHTTIERLSIQRNALTNVMAHRESIVNLQMMAMITDQRRIAQASKKDGNALKRLSMMGAVFFPGTFVASLFSMSFFNFRGADPANGTGPRIDVAPQLWLYFAVSVPLTVIVVLFMWLWDRKRERRVKRETRALESGVVNMEKQVMMQLQRQRMEDRC